MPSLYDDRAKPAKGRLRVLIFSPDPDLGGGVVEFSEVLKKRLDPSFESEWFITGRRSGLLGTAFRAIVPLLDGLRLFARVMTRHHDVYHLNTSLTPRSVIRDGLFLLILRFCRRRSVLVFFRGWDRGYFHNIASSRICRYLFLYTYGHAMRVLVLASPFSDDLRRLGLAPATIHVLTTMFDGDTLRKAVRSRTDTEIRILFLARFVAAKGMYQLLEAFRRVSRDRPTVRLTMAGDGEEASNARAWCDQHGLRNRVSFPGYVEGADKAQLLVDSDIFVLASYHHEGCPNALLEAMGAGLPVIVSPAGGIPDVVRDGVNGIVVAPRDTDALEGALRKLIDNPDLRAEIARKNRAEAWEAFESRAVTVRLESHYRSLHSRTET
jgi:glycosyltransferase involved in cell wall biosynthesis